MQSGQLGRRAFITLLGGAVAWPLASRAQQPERMRRIGVLTAFTPDDPESQARMAAFLRGLQELGWSDGRNVRIDTRWAAGDADHYRRYAAELVALAPDVILANGGPAMEPLLRATRTVPIVFVSVADPVGTGFVASLARPGGNATGFTAFEYGLSGKWLELLKQIAPRVTRVCCPSGYCKPHRDRPVCRNPGRRILIRGGAKPDRHARRRESSAPSRRSHASRMAV